MSYQQIVNEEQRLVILRGLEDLNGKSNDSMLQTVLESYGLSASRDQVKNHILWLEEQGLVRIERLGETLVVHQTQRGHDVACGRARVVGVKRPGPAS